MNRLIICIILLSLSSVSLAEKLYRWIEADGSITFSPEPPPAGVDFKVMDAGQGDSQALTNKQKSIMATSEHSLDTAPTAPINNTAVLTRPAPAVSKQGLSYAPETSKINTITRQATVQQPIAQADAEPGHQTIASNNKEKQCQDLSKRVISLERRLRMPLEPVDMDNTVIAMARYQKSYDQYCT